MYIETVRIKNIRCIEDVTLDLRSPQGPKKLAVVVGDNGAGKTTLLRAIAMGLCDKDSTSGLLRDTTGDLIRKGANSARIRIDLRAGAKSYRITTTFAKSGTGFEIVSRRATKPSRGFPWRSIFVCGYGADRGTEGAEDTDRYSAADAVYTLFRYDWSLLNPEVVLWRRTRGDKKKIEEICKAMDRILMLPPGSTRLDDNGLRVSDTRRFVAGIGAMADGYAGTLTWVLDMLWWWHVAHPNAISRPPEGIMLIDEIEQHLHPRWQRNIISLLTQAFPKVQFIATTHSPLVVSGSDKCAVLALHRGTYTDKNVQGWLAEDVYREVMGLSTSRASTYEKDIHTYEQLHFKSLQHPLSRSEADTLASIAARLKRLPGTDPIAILTKLKNLRRGF